MKKFIEDNFIVIVIVIMIIVGLYNFMQPDYKSDNSDCTEYETTSQGTFCTE